MITSLDIHDMNGFNIFILFSFIFFYFLLFFRKYDFLDIDKNNYD